MTIKQIACHEAGHAVAFHRLWPDCTRYPGELTIMRADNALGSHISEELTFPVTTDPEMVAAHDTEFENDALYACAGYAALLAAGYTESEAEEGCGSDFETAEKASSQPLEFIKQEAAAMMRQPENVRAVARIAEELLKRKTISDPDEVAIMIEIADGGATEDDYLVYLALKGS